MKIIQPCREAGKRPPGYGFLLLLAANRPPGKVDIAELLQTGRIAPGHYTEIFARLWRADTRQAAAYDVDGGKVVIDIGS